MASSRMTSALARNRSASKEPREKMDDRVIQALLENRDLKVKRALVANLDYRGIQENEVQPGLRDPPGEEANEAIREGQDFLVLRGTKDQKETRGSPVYPECPENLSLLQSLRHLPYH